MRIRLFILALLLLPVCLSVSAVEAANSFSVVFCNYTGKGKIWIAQRYYDVEVGNDVVQGWWGVEDGECHTFSHSLGNFGGSTWAWFAYNNHFSWAGSGEKRCVDKSSKFLVYEVSRACSGSQQLVGFTQFHVKAGMAAYTVNLDN